MECNSLLLPNSSADRGRQTERSLQVRNRRLRSHPVSGCHATIQWQQAEMADNSTRSGEFIVGLCSVRRVATAEEVSEEGRKTIFYGAASVQRLISDFRLFAGEKKTPSFTLRPSECFCRLFIEQSSAIVTLFAVGSAPLATFSYSVQLRIGTPMCRAPRTEGRKAIVLV